MSKIIFCVLCVFIVNVTEANTWKTPENREEFCVQAKDWDSFQRLVEEDENQLDFANSGGLFHGGVCWWHSRFQRSAVYLTVFQPHQPKPDSKTVKEIIRDIIHNRKVVEVPGYQNLEMFSADHWKEIQKALENWQIEDGILHFAWINGLVGRSKTSPEKLKRIMDRLYREVESKRRISYQKLQMSGIAAHAWLVTDMVRLPDGYELKVVDSNAPGQVSEVLYQYGDTYIRYDEWILVPYTQHQWWDFRKIRRAIKKYCAD